MKRFLALVLAMLMVIALVACGGSKTPTTSGGDKPAASTPATPDKPTEPAKPAEPKILNVGSTATAATACNLVSQGTGDIAINQQTVATLYMVLPEGGKAKMMPALADGDPIDVNGDGMTWNIKINPKSMFENGEKITADTMVYTLKMALDPKLVFKYGGTVASNYVTIVNATEYYTQVSKGVEVKWEDVGVKKVDDMTIQVVLTTPANAALVMRHFTSRLTAPIYQPLFEKCLSADGTTSTYGSSKDTWISSGPFKLTNWVIGSVREFEKNENFIRADLVKLDGMIQKVVSESGTLTQLFDNGEIDYISLGADSMDKYGDDPRIENSPSRRVDTMVFNEKSSNTILQNENFRLALYWGTDRAAIAKVAGELPGAGMINYRPAMPDGTRYRDVADAVGYMPANNGYDPVKAKAYFDKALQETGKTSVEVTFTMISGETQQETITQFVQESWPQLFGADKIKVNINSMPSSAYSAQIKTWKDNDDAYEICFSKWDLAASTWDPIQALRVYTTTYSGRYAQFDSYPVLTDLYNKANKEYLLDDEKRCEIAMEMEKYILEHAVAIPVLYRTDYTIISDRLELAVDKWDSELGWGYRYCDIAQ